LFQSGNDDLFAALQHLKYNNHEVIIFDVHDKHNEVEFDFSHRPYIFKDSETGEELKLHPNAVKESYLAAYHDHQQALKLKCLQYKIDYNEAIVENNFNQVLMPFVMKRRQ
jgi:hypothetical protein